MGKTEEKGRPAYVILSRKLMIAWLVSYLLLFVGILGSYQYANLVAQQLCGVIQLSNDTYKKQPPPSETGKLMAKEFSKIIKKYHCK
jgi:hypothetical protein